MEETSGRAGDTRRTLRIQRPGLQSRGRASIDMRIFLTGFMGAGKTTVGRMLAGELTCDFYDLDQEIERRGGATIASMFEDYGEPQFRVWEFECLKSLESDNSVIATGGGCFITNHEWMLKNGVVIHLKVPFETLARRLGADPSRPLWRNAQKLFAEREQLYEKAHHAVDADAEPQEVLRRIKDVLPLP